MKKQSTSTIITLWVLAVSFLFFPALLSAEEVETTLPAGWRLITLPVEPEEEVDTCELFGREKVVRVEGTEYSDCAEIGEWEPGRGFWVYLDEDTTIRIAGKTISAEETYTMGLTPGWNQVGTPYNFSISVNESLYVDGMPFKSSNSVRPGIYGYDAETDSYYEANYLYPWEGYLMYAMKTADLVIIPVEGEGDQGPAVTLRITDAQGPGGKAVEVLDLDPGESVKLWAAGYDVNNRFTGNVNVVWSAGGGLTVAAGTAGDHMTFTPGDTDTGGRITASVSSLSDLTGRITVLGTGDLYAYPFAADTELLEDPDTGTSYIADQVLVSFAAGTTDATARGMIESAGGRVVGRNAVMNTYQVKIPASAQAAQFAAGLDDPAIQSASLNYVFSHGALPADPAFAPTAPAAQKWAHEKVRVDGVWGMVAPTNSPLVAVVDSGIDSTHPDLAGRIETGKNFLDPGAATDISDSSGHGTAMAGLIAAVPGNGIGTAGFCFTCRIMPLKVCDSSGYCPSFQVANAITYAADNGAKIINLSIGAELPAGSPAANVLATATDYAASAGALAVAAAGNKSKDYGNFLPAAISGVFSVAAVDSNDARAAFSNYGAGVDACAPGQQVYTTAPGGYELLDGTSVSSAIVSGLAGLAFSLREDITASEAAALIKESGVLLSTDKPIGPRADAQALVALLLSANGAPHIQTLALDTRIASPGDSVTVTVTATDPDADPLEVAWSVDAGSISPSGADSAVWSLPNARGNYSVTVTASDILGATAQATAYILVLDGGLEQISVAPSGISIQTGETVQFAAACYDQAALDGTAAAVPCSVQWGQQLPLGVFTNSGLFTATTPGTGSMIASFAGYSGTAEITVTDSGGGGGLFTTTDTTSCGASTWPMYGCNTAGTFSSLQKLAPPLTIRKYAEFSGAPPAGITTTGVFSTAAIADNGFIYTGQSSDLLYKIDHVTMTVVAGWPLDLTEGIRPATVVSGSPVFDAAKQNIYITDENGYIFKVNITTDPGTIKWIWSPAAGGTTRFRTSVTVDGNILYAATSRENSQSQYGRIYAIRDDTNSATLLWSYPPMADPPATSFSYSTPKLVSIGGDTLVTAGTIGGSIFVIDTDACILDPLNCTPVHTFLTGAGLFSTPAVVNNYIYYTDNGGKFRKYDPTPVTGGQIWEAPIDNSQTSPAYDSNIFYITTITGKVFAIQDNGATYDDTVWTQAADLGLVVCSDAPILYPAGGIVEGGGSAPAGMLVTTYNAGTIMAVNKSDGSVVTLPSDPATPWKYNTSNISASPIILQNGSEVEAYVGMSTNKFAALERNFAPVIDSFLLHERPTNGVPMIPGDGVSASTTVFVSDPNGVKDIDRVELDLTPLRGISNLSLKYKSAGIYINSPLADMPITVPAGFPAGPATLTATVYDLAGVSSQATAELDVADMPPTIVSVSFNPSFLFPNGLDTTTVTVVVQDINIVSGEANADPVITLDIDPIQGNTSVPNPITLSCGNGYIDAGTQRMSCTAAGITAVIGTPPGDTDLTATASDTINTDTDIGTLEITGPDSFVLTPDPLDPTAGEFATVTVTAFNATYGQITNYVNAANIIVTINNGTEATISYQDTITLPDGSIALATGTFSAGQATFRIRNTTAETLTVTATDSAGSNGTSDPIEWVARILDSFDVYWTPADIVKGDFTDVQITAIDEFGNTVKIFTNPDGLLISHVSGADPANLQFDHSTPAAVSDNGDGTADFAAGYFTDGVAAFKVMSTVSYTDVIFKVDDNGSPVTANSNSIKWRMGLLGYFTLEQIFPVPPGNPITGATATIRITAYDNTAFPAVLTDYNNKQDIVLDQAGGTGATMAWEEANGVDDQGGGLANLIGENNGGGWFTNGVSEIKIGNTTAETATISVTEFDRTPNISETIDITWVPGPIEYFDVFIAPAQTDVITGTTITATLTAKDKYGFTSVDYQNASGVDLVQSVGTSGTGFSWAGTDVIPQPGYNSIITGMGTAFAAGIATFDITDTKINRGVTITVTDVATSKFGTSVPINWNPGPLADFLITTNPTSLVVGATTSISITAFDAFGNIKDDFTQSITLGTTNGTAASLTWSDRGGAPVSGGAATFAGTRFSSGIATATLQDTMAEGPIFVTATYIGSSSQSAVLDSPTWSPGPFSTLKIRDAANNAGSEIDTYTLPIFDSLTCWAAAYDQYDNYISDIVSTWATTGDLDATPAGPSDNTVFTPSTPYTDGTITADSAGISDETGNIHVESGEPNPPTLTATPEVDQIRLTWVPPSTYIDGLPVDSADLSYKIYRADTQGGPFADPPLATTGLGEASYVDAAPSVVRWQEYFYKIIAVKPAASTQSDFSNEDSAAPFGPQFTFVKACAVQDPLIFHPPDYPGYINRPRDLSSDGTYLYVSDTDNHRISVFQESDCAFVPPPWGEFGFATGEFKYPDGIVFSGAAVYVADDLDRYQEFDTAGNITTQHETIPRALKIDTDGAGSLFITSATSKVFKVDAASGVVDEGASFTAPNSTGIAYSGGTLYVADSAAGLIRIFDASGTETGTIGEPGNKYGQLDNPQGVAVDAAGNVFVADTGNHRVQLFAPDGTLLNSIGGFGYGSGLLRGPLGVEISPATGNLWIADTQNQQISEFAPPAP